MSEEIFEEHIERENRLIGSYSRSLNDLMEFISLASSRIVKPPVSNWFSINQATEAIHMLKNGKIVGRCVINP
jgi:propanol-preferring alcohol dehydrogenase